MDQIGTLWTLREALWGLHKDVQGQDLIEYVIIVAFGIMLIAALTALYNTARSILERANSELQSIPSR